MSIIQNTTVFPLNSNDNALIKNHVTIKYNSKVVVLQVLQNLILLYNQKELLKSYKMTTLHFDVFTHNQSLHYNGQIKDKYIKLNHCKWKIFTSL